MITGTVNARLEATIHVPVRDAAGLDHTIETVIDTGFSGSLTLPSSLIAAFGLPWRSRGTAVLANGAIDHFDIHTATVMWDGQARRILVEAAETDPLVGTGLLADHELRSQFVVGGTVTIQTMP